MSIAMSERGRDPSGLTIAESIRRYLNRRRSDSTESSVYSWEYRLKLWREWCEDVGIESVGELRPFDMDEYYDHRSAETAPSTLEGEMWTLRKYIEYLEQLGAVDAGLHESVRIPDVGHEQRSNDTRLAEPQALDLLRWYRSTGEAYGSRNHAFLEIAWTTGARMGGIRGLDLRDVYLDESFVDFRHRPESGTPLKNKYRGERPVAIPKEANEALSAYIRSERHDVHDDHGRAPLLTSQKGRPGTNTIRVWSYLATEPCLYRDCPHGKYRDTCEWTQYAHASKCPSSRSPHQIRTGSITWQRNIGLPPEVVAQRVNATVQVIEDHYDKETARERMERRRRQFMHLMEFDDDS